MILRRFQRGPEKLGRRARSSEKQVPPARRGATGACRQKTLLQSKILGEIQKTFGRNLLHFAILSTGGSYLRYHGIIAVELTLLVDYIEGCYFTGT